MVVLCCCTAVFPSSPLSPHHFLSFISLKSRCGIMAHSMGILYQSESHEFLISINLDAYTQAVSNFSGQATSSLQFQTGGTLHFNTQNNSLTRLSHTRGSFEILLQTAGLFSVCVSTVRLTAAIITFQNCKTLPQRVINCYQPLNVSNSSIVLLICRCLVYVITKVFCQSSFLVGDIITVWIISTGNGGKQMKCIN